MLLTIGWPNSFSATELVVKKESHITVQSKIIRPPILLILYYIKKRRKKCKIKIIYMNLPAMSVDEKLEFTTKIRSCIHCT